MQLTINNLTASPLSFLGGALTVAASGSTTAPLNQLFPVARDAQLIADCINNIVSLSDGVDTYFNGDALNYLNTIASSLGGQVVGYIGAAVPSFAICVGAKDPSGNVQFGTVNAINELIMQFSNSYSHYTGNGTHTVKSGAGRLHSIMINNNTTGGSVTAYDNTAASGTVIATIQIGSPSGGLLSTSGQQGPVNYGPLGLEFTTGLTVVTAGSSSNDITVLYR